MMIDLYRIRIVYSTIVKYLIVFKKLFITNVYTYG